MNVKAIMQYLGKCRREISELANVRGEKSVSYWFDYLWCAVRHGCLIRQYVYGEFYRLSSIDRKESMTYPRLIKGRTRQTLWSAVQMLTQKLCCQTIHDCPKVVPLHYESE